MDTLSSIIKTDRLNTFCAPLDRLKLHRHIYYRDPIRGNWFSYNPPNNSKAQLAWQSINSYGFTYSSQLTLMARLILKVPSVRNSFYAFYTNSDLHMFGDYYPALDLIRHLFIIGAILKQYDVAREALTYPSPPIIPLVRLY